MLVCRFDKMIPNASIQIREEDTKCKYTDFRTGYQMQIYRFEKRIPNANMQI